jgi:hypothetical protein
MRGKTCFTVKDGRDGLDSRRVQEAWELLEFGQFVTFASRRRGVWVNFIPPYTKFVRDPPFLLT